MRRRSAGVVTAGREGQSARCLVTALIKQLGVRRRGGGLRPPGLGTRAELRLPASRLPGQEVSGFELGAASIPLLYCILER